MTPRGSAHGSLNTSPRHLTPVQRACQQRRYFDIDLRTTNTMSSLKEFLNFMCYKQCVLRIPIPSSLTFTSASDFSNVVILTHMSPNTIDDNQRGIFEIFHFVFIILGLMIEITEFRTIGVEKRFKLCSYREVEVRL